MQYYKHWFDWSSTSSLLSLDIKVKYELVAHDKLFASLFGHFLCLGLARSGVVTGQDEVLLEGGGEPTVLVLLRLPLVLVVDHHVEIEARAGGHLALVHLVHLVVGLLQAARVPLAHPPLEGALLLLRLPLVLQSVRQDRRVYPGG